MSFSTTTFRPSAAWNSVSAFVPIHSEEMLPAVQQRYPAAHYVVVDDKLRILAAVKGTWGARVTTIFPRQGHYALDARVTAAYPSADLTLAGIGELAGCRLDMLPSAGASQRLG